MKVSQCSTKDLSTFQLDDREVELTTIERREELLALFNKSYFDTPDWTVIGGGSNTVFVTDTIKRVIQLDLTLVTVEVKESNAIYTVDAGLGWDECVTISVNNHHWGLENLSLIPGTVGGAPVQNIGAYGTELDKTLVKLEYFDTVTGEFVLLSNEECEFGYRDSVFKHRLKQRAIITRVWMRLSLLPNPILTYNGIMEALEGRSVSSLTPKDIADIVITERKSKILDPKESPNVGSFFTNPVITLEQSEYLKSVFEEAPIFPFGTVFKTSAAYLIDQCGLKGIRSGGISVSLKHSLVLTNENNGTAQDLRSLISTIITTVEQKTGIILYPEPNLL